MEGQGYRFPLWFTAPSPIPASQEPWNLSAVVGWVGRRDVEPHRAHEVHLPLPGIHSPLQVVYQLPRGCLHWAQWVLHLRE